MNEYENLSRLDAAQRGPFRFVVDGQRYVVVDPADLAWEDLLRVLFEEHVPGTPRMSEARRTELFRAWVAHYDLPTFNDARRLAYNVNRYTRTLENDLRIHARVALGPLWRERRWSELLNAIDYLPSHSHYGEAVANDPEHAAMLAQALAERADGAAAGSEDDAESSPPLHTWDPTVNVLTNILDAVRGVQFAVVASNYEGKGKKPEPPTPSPRPKTVMDRARKQAVYDRKLAKHKALTARMLPHKAEPTD